MRRILILLVFILGVVSTIAQVQRKVAEANDSDSAVFSDQRAGKESFNKAARGNVSKELDLTREQKLQLKEMRQGNKLKREQVMNDEALTEEQKQDKLKEIKKAATNNLLQILTEEQQLKLKAIRKAAKNHNGADSTGKEQFLKLKTDS